MNAQLPDGRATGVAILADLRAPIAGSAARGSQPGPGTLLVGDDPGSRANVRGTHRDCADMGIVSAQRGLPAVGTQAESAGPGER